MIFLACGKQAKMSKTESEESESEYLISTLSIYNKETKNNKEASLVEDEQVKNCMVVCVENGFLVSNEHKEERNRQLFGTKKWIATKRDPEITYLIWNVPRTGWTVLV